MAQAGERLILLVPLCRGNHPLSQGLTALAGFMNKCLWCGAQLYGGATQHDKSCWLHPENLMAEIVRREKERSKYEKDQKKARMDNEAK